MRCPKRYPNLFFDGTLSSRSLTGSRRLFFLLLRMGRFFSLVDTPEHREEFEKQYRIPSDVTIEYFHLGEWHEKWPSEAITIPMIAFIKGGMKIPMGKVTGDFFMPFQALSYSVCALKMFRILDSVDAMNDKMGINLTHHDDNWVYSCQNNSEARYYLKTSVPVVRLISYLSKTNKGMDEDFLIVLGV